MPHATFSIIPELTTPIGVPKLDSPIVWHYRFEGSPDTFDALLAKFLHRAAGDIFDMRTLQTRLNVLAPELQPVPSEDTWTNSVYDYSLNSRYQLTKRSANGNREILSSLVPFINQHIEQTKKGDVFLYQLSRHSQLMRIDTAVIFLERHLETLKAKIRKEQYSLVSYHLDTLAPLVKALASPETTVSASHKARLKHAIFTVNELLTAMEAKA